MLSFRFQTIRPPRKTAGRCIFLWGLPSLMLLFLLSTTSRTSASNAPSATVTSQRARYIRQLLTDRLHYVQSHQRTHDFQRWARSGGQIQVVSTHGAASPTIKSTQADEEIDSDQKETKLIVQRKQRTNDPFSSDLFDLDVPTPSSNDDDSETNIPPNCYTGQSLQRKEGGIIRNWELLVRAMRLFFTFGPCLSTIGLAILSKRYREGVWYPWVTSCLGASGAAWIKWGQWSSTRSDMFPEALCDELATLHAAAPAHDWSYSETTLASTLGVDPSSLVPDIFDEFDREPIASGSIAQVHRAVLAGRAVAVKLRHPRVARLMELDFRIMTVLARMLDTIPALSWLHIRETIQQFSTTMADQAYLQVEAHHLEALNYNFRNWHQVQFPHPFYASPNCIMESFEPGKIVTTLMDKYESVADFVDRGVTEGYLQEQNSPQKNDNQDDTVKTSLHLHDVMPTFAKHFIVTNGLGIYLKMLLVDNLMHADLHPGNILLDFKKAHGSKDHQITLVDAGMVAQLERDESSIFVGMLASLGEGNGREAADFALKFSVDNAMTGEEKEAFRIDMIDFFAEHCRGYGTNVDIGRVLRGVLNLIRKHHVRIDANYATLVINILCLESMARQVCPSYDLLDSARPLLQSMRRWSYHADGTPKHERSRFLDLWLSLMNWRKQSREKSFFRNQVIDRNWVVTKNVAY